MYTRLSFTYKHNNNNIRMLLKAVSLYVCYMYSKEKHIENNNNYTGLSVTNINNSKNNIQYNT